MTGIIVQYVFTPAAIIMNVFDTEMFISFVLCDLMKLIHSFVLLKLTLMTGLNKPKKQTPLQTHP